MGVPDLLGSQGTFLLFTTRPITATSDTEGGLRIAMPRGQDRIDTAIPGPPNPYRVGTPAMTIPLSLALDRAHQRVRTTIGGETITLEVGKLSDWISLPFRAAPGLTVHGLSRLLITELGDHVSLYASPINIDPARPVMPISHPSFYATYLPKKIGPFATLGLAEDTSALNEGVTDDATFLEQTWDIDDEREAMLVTGLDRLKQGTIVCVFDATDRVQHMFWRDIDPRHPAGRGRETAPHRDAIASAVQTQRRPARTPVRAAFRIDDVLMVISDHGFNSFRRGINLNAWLRPRATSR